MTENKFKFKTFMLLYDIFPLLGWIGFFTGIVAGVALNNFSLIFVIIFIYMPICIFIETSLEKEYLRLKEKEHYDAIKSQKEYYDDKKRI